MQLRAIVNQCWDKALVIFIVLCVLLPISPLNMPFATRDSGVFLYIGWRILNGDVPYRDVWDHKPPIIFYINALGLFISDNSRWGVWLIEFIAVLAAAFIGFRLIKKVFGTGPAIMSSFLWLFSLVFMIEGGNFTTEYTLPLQFTCLWLVCDVNEGKIPYLHWFLLGVINAIAFFTKQTTVGIGVAILLYFAFQRVKSGQFKRWFGEFLVILGGGLLVCVGVTAFFYIQGSLGQFWSAAFEYNFAYISSSIGDFSARLNIILGWVFLTRTGLFQFALVGYIIGFIFYKKYITNPWFPLLSIGLIDLPIELAMVGASGRVYPHYYMTLLPSLSLFAGFAVWGLLSQLSILKIPRVVIPATLSSVVMIIILSSFGAYREQVDAFTRIGNKAVIDYISAFTSPNDSVLLWGAEASVNYFSHRRSPSRFVYQYPLYNRRYVDEQMIEEFLGEVIRNRPQLIVDTKNAETPLYDLPIKTEKVQADIAYLQSHYRRKTDLGTWTIYEYAGESLSP